MSRSIHNQENYVLVFLKAAGAVVDDPEHLEKLRKTWFRNTLNRQSLRLTQEGFKFATRISDIETYTFQLTESITPRVMLQMEQHIRCPYFIRTLKVVKLFGEKESMMLGLHTGDMKSWLDQLDSFR